LFYNAARDAYLMFMDPFTHLSSGIMGALAARKWLPSARFLVPLGMLCAWIPDADILFGNGDPEFSLLHHRGITTSFTGGLFLALAVTALYRAVISRTPYLKTALFTYALILTHIWLDLITTYGTQILAPFSNHRFALDGAFIFDPLFTGTALLAILLAMVMKRHRHVIAMTGMVWLFAYPLTMMALGAHLETMYENRLAARGIAFDDVHVTPDALAPRYWKVVTTQETDYLLDTLDLAGEPVPPPRRFRRADTTELETLGRQESMFSTYAWFAGWPYVVRTSTPTGTAITFGDLRFVSTNPIMLRLFKGRRQPFVLHAEIAPDGTIVSWRFTMGASSFDESMER
jgi:inner membrane protein